MCLCNSESQVVWTIIYSNNLSSTKLYTTVETHLSFVLWHSGKPLARLSQLMIISESIFSQDVRILLEEMPLLKKFNMDARKFSRNIELSSFSTMLNAGAGVESNFIWSV